MAEEGSEFEIEGLETQLQSLLSRYSSDDLRDESKPFCADFSKLVEEFTSRWQVPLPQLRILETSLCYFARASTFFTLNCDHVLHTLSSLALSVFELLLFFDQKDFYQEPLQSFTVTFQECCVVLARHQNVHLLQVARMVQDNGPWASQVLLAILSESSLPQNEVDECISSELPVFFELRVRYLLSCERVSGAMALAQCCARHPTAGQHSFFLQIYLTWLYKTSQHDRLRNEVDDINGKDAVHIICNLECEEKDNLLLALSRAFLSQQLSRGDMYYLCDLVFIWSKLHCRLNTSKQALLEEIGQVMLSATNVNSIFPFIRAVLQELGEDGKQFCVELCANALESCLPCDVITKSLIYKTIAGLLPNDLEVCRLCALLVFFLERTVEAYKRVYLLYMHPDQEYHVEYSLIGNNVRFELLRILKKDLHFDPEFWNLIALRTNCLKLMSERVVGAALEEIMEDKWIPSYCTKESTFQSSRSLCQKGSQEEIQAAEKNRHHKDGNTDHTAKKKGTHGSRLRRESLSQPLRRSFWKLDRIQDGVTVRYGEHRRTTRLSEKNPPKRRIRTPKWLLEDSGTVEKNRAPQRIKKQWLKHQKHHQSAVVKRSEIDLEKNTAKHKPSINSHLKAMEMNKHQRGFSVCPKPDPPPQVILELSLPDNELMGTFNEDSCNRLRGLPQVLLYKPTVKLSTTSQPVKAVHRKEVILRARDVPMFVQQLHCYARRQKGKGNGLNVHGSVSTITRSSVQGCPPKDPPKHRYKKHELKSRTASRKITGAGGAALSLLEKVPPDQAPLLQVTNSSVLGEVPQPSKEKDLQAITSARGLHEQSPAEVNASQTSAKAEVIEAPVLDTVRHAQTIVPARKLCDEPAVEMKVTIASQTSAAKVSHSPALEKVCKAQSEQGLSVITTSAEISQTTAANSNQKMNTDEIPSVCKAANNSDTGVADFVTSQSQDVLGDGEKEKSDSSQAETDKIFPTDSGHGPCEDTSIRGDVVTLNKVSEAGALYLSSNQDSMNGISSLTLVTEMVTELEPEVLARDLENGKRPAQENSASKKSMARSKAKVLDKTWTTSSCLVPTQERSAVADVQLKERMEETEDDAPEIPENSEAMETLPESEESKLDFCCTFCNKDFKGCRVVAHAMFHYRKDECMFCGTMFKDDLLAMMHLSDHIEKLKRTIAAANKNQENGVSETKGISTPQTSAKHKTPNMSPDCRSRGRPRKSAVFPKLASPNDSSPTRFRKLRSNDKPVHGQSSQEKKQTTPSQEKRENTSSQKRQRSTSSQEKQQKASSSLQEHKQNTSNYSELPVHKVNGHVGKKKKLQDVRPKPKQPLIQQEMTQETTRAASEFPKLSENQVRGMNSSGSAVQVDCSTESGEEAESLQFLKEATKQNGKAVKNVEPQEKVSCPVDECAWSTDLAKNRVALLYHALENHHDEVKPLELAFRVSNSKCAICMRVLWSFEHFLHHVERHKMVPRHPCLHQGCTARFKTGMEMRRHTRKHSPLQAVCCLPGCSQLFICLWALNLHEREHYASKPTKPNKITSEQKGDKQNNVGLGKKQDNESKDGALNTAVNKTLSLKVARKLRRHTKRNLSRKHVKALPRIRGSVLRRELKGRNESNDSNVLQNLSNKDSEEPSFPNLRLRQSLRKVTNSTTAAPKTHTVISSSLRRNSKLKHRLKKKQANVNSECPKRRGRPPKSRNSVPDENTSTSQNNETNKEKSLLQKDPQSSCPSITETTSNVNDGQQEIVKATEKSGDKSKSNKSVLNQLRKLVKQKMGSRNKSTTVEPSASVSKTQTLTTEKGHKTKKSSTQENGFQVKALKKEKLSKSKVSTKAGKKKCPLKELESASEKPAEALSVASQVNAKAVALESSDENGNTKVKNTESAQNDMSDPGLNEASAPEVEIQKEPKQDKLKKSLTVKKDRKKKTDSSELGKGKKKQKDASNKTTVKKPAVKKMKKPKCEEQQPDAAKAAAQVQSTTDVKESIKDEPPTTSGPSISVDSSSSTEKTCPPTATEDNTQTLTTDQIKVKKSRKMTTDKIKVKKSKEAKQSDPNKKAKKRKSDHVDGDAKNVKKRKRKEIPSASEEPAKSEPEIQPLTEVKEDAERSSACEQRKTQEEVNLKIPLVKTSVSTVALSLYSKKPFMRPPPTAYLDEKFTTMPKRRKEMFFQPSRINPPPEIATPQRQRCATCFATFTSNEDLQKHLQLQKCSKLFGFDSDDEGNS
ncbi:microtubule-associated protein futsch-like [Solea senegalensis]|uniref:Microtubule-associated protein futsch-like n=3 Tax=Solea senegalensis TaxID=28829 RepID=A0AAV6REH3_SOLSE|nr:uncharacterized protein LOC122761524 [Solea senegalensis]KAG7503741.1 microtubule-associated protein futsch-like [Solea senegalensis]